MNALVLPWHDSSTGPCAICRQPTCRYGPQGKPLCDDCDEKRVSAVAGRPVVEDVAS